MVSSPFFQGNGPRLTVVDAGVKKKNRTYVEDPAPRSGVRLRLYAVQHRVHAALGAGHEQAVAQRRVAYRRRAAPLAVADREQAAAAAGVERRVEAALDAFPIAQVLVK